MDDAKYLAVGRILLEETKAALPVPQTVREARRWQAALVLKCTERARREQGADFEEWQEAEPSPEAAAAYERMTEELLEEGRPS
jgi:hypothetical protein